MGQETTSTGAFGYGSYKALMDRRQSQSLRGARQRERMRNYWRAGLAALLIMLALSTGFFAGAHSTAVVEMLSFISGNPEALSASNARRSELRNGKILFALPDGENCRPMHFDNQTGEMIPGTGTVPCYTRDQKKTVVQSSNSKFNWSRP
jgi:hypothetical protein